MTAELDRLEAEVVAARARLSCAVGRLTADAAPAAVGSSAARLSLEWAGSQAGGRAVDWLRKRPVVSLFCLAGIVVILGRLGEGPRTVPPPDFEGRAKDGTFRIRA